MRKFIIFLAVFVMFSLTITAGCTATAMENSEQNVVNGSARSAYLMDYDTGTVIYERNSDAKHPIASMVKIMTLLLTFENVNNGTLSLDEKLTISQTASGMGGSQMFLDAGKEYSVSDLIKGVTVVSANDASVALAEAISGSKEAFVDLMNEKAQKLGMVNTVFVNVTGLPESGQHSTAKDVSIMMRELLKNDEYYKYSGIYMENYTHPDGRISELVNTNKLIRFYNGCDAGKTGFTNDAMFCLSASAKRDGTRFIATVLGAQSSKERFAEVSGMFNYAFANYKNTKIVDKTQLISNEITIKGGKSETIEICADRDICALTKKGDKTQYEVSVVVDEKLKAPIKKGAVIGKIVVTSKVDGAVIGEANIITMKDVDSKSLADSIKDISDSWFFGK